ncbi:MAG: 3-phosphoshikimate 1-carboxyvinyltransferase [Thermoplasmata archaeon]
MIRTIRPGRAQGIIRAPGSKSYTHRALAIAAIGDRTLRIRHPLDSEDTRTTLEGIRRFGAEVNLDAGVWTVRPPRRGLTRATTIPCRQSGTTLRLLTGLAALHDRPVRFSGEGRLPLRPMEPLLRALEELGARVYRPRTGRSLPFTIQGPIEPGAIRLSASDSSQPVSSLMIALSAFDRPSRVRLVGPVVSAPYIDASLAILRRLGYRVDGGPRQFAVRGRVRPMPRTIEIPADASSAAYLWAAAAISGGTVSVTGLDPRYPQADLRVLEAFDRMGARVERRGSTVLVRGPLRRGLRFDLTDSPDLFPLLGILAARVPGGRSTLTGAPHLRHKESDRWAGTVDLVRAFGAQTLGANGQLVIRPPSEMTAILRPSATDHRLVMSAAVGALAASAPSRIGDARAVAKSYPGGWTDLAKLTPHSMGAA